MQGINGVGSPTTNSFEIKLQSFKEYMCRLFKDTLKAQFWSNNDVVPHCHLGQVILSILNLHLCFLNV